MGAIDLSAITDTNHVLTASGLQAWTEAFRKLDMQLYDIAQEGASLLRVGIRNMPGGNPYLMGMDKTTVARRVSKPVFHLANLHFEAAKAASAANRIYVVQFAKPKHVNAGKVFDPTK
jgi:hypothetical protein